MADAALDRWAAWILERRFGADPEQAERSLRGTLGDFDERDLIAFAERAGFRSVELDYEARVEHGARPRWLADVGWDTFLRIAPNPLTPTFGEMVDQALTPEEAERFIGYLKSQYEDGNGTSRNAVAYLRAIA